jgi:dTDP-4-dehydrorhamnose reductase
VCGLELLGRLEFARGIAAELGLDASLLHGIDTRALGQKARRPLAAGLLTEKLRRMYPELEMCGLAASLKDCRAEIDAFLRSG